MKKMSSRDDENASRRVSKENEDPYLSITRARDSLKQREESKKKEAEMSQLEEELNELRRRNEADRVGLQDLEAMLIKRRRRVEKCRRLAEAQSSYRTALEKMIRDAMHQNVVYKEQIRLNQAAVSALTARLEAQRAMCDESEADLRRKYRQRDELEKNARPCWEEQARKRSRVDHAFFEERYEDRVKAWAPTKKELRVFLEEEQRASQALRGEHEEEEDTIRDRIGAQMRRLASGGGVCENANEVDDERRRRNGEEEDDEEHRKRVGKGNVEKWLQMMLKNAKDGPSSSSSVGSPEKEKDGGEEEMKYLRLRPREGRRRSASPGRGVGRRGGGESSRGFRSVPSSPLALPGTKKSFNEANPMAPSSSSSNNFIKRPVNK